jgi:hypothetical protein
MIRMRQDLPRRSPSSVRNLPWPRRADAIALAALVAISVALSAATIVRRPESTVNAAYLFQDEGLNLLVADVVNAGGILYRDLAYPYGPLPAYLHAAVARAFGNTPLVYLLYVIAMSSMTVALAFALMRRAADTGVAAFVAAVGVVTTIIVPGSLIGGQTTAAYVPVERAALLAVALCWSDPDRRSLKRSIALGVTLGLWQLVRFGGAIVAGGSILLLDALCLAASSSPGRIARWFRSSIVVAGAFLAIELLWIVIAFAMLPRDVALDAIWPAYVLEAYGEWVSSEIRWLPWGGWRLFVVQYLVPFSGGVLGLFGIYQSTHHRAEDGDGRAVFLPLFFFIVGGFVYFKQVHHFRQFMWTLVPASAWWLARTTWRWRVATALLWAPGFLIVVRSSLVGAAASTMITAALPAGGAIVIDRRQAERIAFLERFVREESRAQPVIYLDSGAGWYHAFQVPRATRHAWFAGFDVIRRYEEDAFIAALDRTVAVIECAKDTRATTAPLPDLPFPETVTAALAPRLTPWKSGGGCRAFRISR